MNNHFVSIIMPALNEALHIVDAIETIRPTSLEYEILVVDGGSIDKTRDLIQKLSLKDKRIRLIDNPAKIQAAGMNLGARLANAKANILVRADCHATYPRNFVEICVGELIERQCASVVVAMRSEGRSCVQTGIAAAQNSFLGNGGSAHRLSPESGFVFHGHHAAFDRSVFLELGGYDETLVANEDAEFDHRLTAKGYRIYMSAQATIAYLPRSSLFGLSRQYFRYGAGRATTCLKHRLVPALRQMYPVLATTGISASLLLALAMPLMLVFPLVYIFLCLIYGFILGVREKSKCHLLAGVAAIVMHISWGVGFLYALSKVGPTLRKS